MSDKKALDGIRIVDFTHQFAGPFGTKILGDFGAEIIWVENPSDFTMRTYTPFPQGKPGINRGGSYLMVSSSKKSIMLNIKHPRGLNIAKKLVEKSDAVIEQFTPGTMEDLGLGYDELRKIKPDIIMLRISGQGQTGPFATQPGFGNLLQSMTGLTQLTGWPDREPIAFWAPYLDFVTGFGNALLLVSALLYRRSTGKGQCIDLPITEIGLQCVGPMLLDWSANQREQQRMGNSLDRAAPHGVYRCQGDDRWCAITVFNDTQWQSFCKVSGKTDLLHDPRFDSLPSRKTHEAELNKLVEEWTSRQSAEQVQDIMQKTGIPAGLWYNNRDIIEHPALRERGFFQTRQHAEVGNYSWPAPPFNLSATPYNPGTTPLAGQDTYSICSEILNMSDMEFADLVAEGIFEVTE